METKHTPGPWEWFKSSGNTTFLRQVIDRGNAVLTFHNGKTVVKLLVTQPNVTGSSIEDFLFNSPDARLIAASPDLLEACKLAYLKIESYLEQLDDLAPYDVTAETDTLCELHDAIAKAEKEY